MQNLLENTEQLVQTNPWLALVAVFLGGVMTASSPCVLAMIPLMMGYVAGAGRSAGRTETDAAGTVVRVGPARAFLYSLVFVLGLSATFVLLGMTAALAGSLYGDVSGVWNWIVVVVCLLMGLHLLGALPVPIPGLRAVRPRVRGVVGALVLGLVFGFVSAPCAAPVIIVLLTYVAGSDASLLYGGLLLLIYALGHSVLILAAGTSVGLARKLIESKRMSRVSELMRRGAGLLILALGAYFAWKGLK